MDSVQIDEELKAFLNENKDIEKADHFKFFDRTTSLQQGSAEKEVAENPAAEFSSADVEKGISDLDTADVEIVWSRAKFTPFYGLVTYVFQKAKKKSAVLPSTIPDDLSENHRELYSVILHELKKPGPVESNKDVLVMLSGIVNTFAPSRISFTLSKTVMASSILAPVDPQSDTHVAVTAVQEKLLGALYPALKKDPYADPQFVQLQKAIWKELCHAVDLKQTELGLATYITLQIMDRIVAWIEHGSFQPPTSEHMFVSAWAWIFNTLFTGTRLRVVPGELISRASADARRIVETEFGSTTSTVSGRKVDMSLRIQVDNQWNSEIAVFEFKSANATQRICDIQQKKSVRLNAAILMDLESRGLDITHHYPIVAEGKGLGLDFYALRRYGDVLGVGRSTRKGITLPSDVAELKTFLQSNSLLTLFAFREYLRRFAIDAIDTLAQSKATPFGYISDEEVETPLPPSPSQPSTPPLRKRSDPFILFTPAKKEKRNHDHQQLHSEDESEYEY